MYLVGSSAIYLVNNSSIFLLLYSDQVPVGLYMFSSGFSVRHSKPKFKDNAILILVQNMHMVFIIFIWLCLVGKMENGE